jgi:hypothetical protein
MIAARKVDHARVFSYTNAVQITLRSIHRQTGPLRQPANPPFDSEGGRRAHCAAAGQRVKDALMILPDRAAKEIEPQWFEEGKNIRVADAFVVDIMLNANGQTYDTMNPDQSGRDWAFTPSAGPSISSNA